MPTHTPQRLGVDIEIYEFQQTRGPIRHAVFDFDGTLSLIRAGWQDVMLGLCVEELVKTPETEDRNNLTRICNDFITQLTGRQTIYQMMRLTEEIAQRGGVPLDPLEYKMALFETFADEDRTPTCRPRARSRKRRLPSLRVDRVARRLGAPRHHLLSGERHR